MTFLETLYLIVGVGLMSACGGRLAHDLGYDGWSQAVWAGFAIGVVLLGQAPTWRLRSKVRELERRLTVQHGRLA